MAFISQKALRVQEGLSVLETLSSFTQQNMQKKAAGVAFRLIRNNLLEGYKAVFQGFDDDLMQMRHVLTELCKEIDNPTSKGSALWWIIQSRLRLAWIPILPRFSNLPKNAANVMNQWKNDLTSHQESVNAFLQGSPIPNTNDHYLRTFALFIKQFELFTDDVQLHLIVPLQQLELVWKSWNTVRAHPTANEISTMHVLVKKTVRKSNRIEAQLERIVQALSLEIN